MSDLRIRGMQESWGMDGEGPQSVEGSWWTKRQARLLDLSSPCKIGILKDLKSSANADSAVVISYLPCGQPGFNP